MRRVFCKVKNYRSYVAGIEAILEREAGFEGGLLVMGPKGSGKTRAAIHHLSDSAYIAYIRAKAAYERPGWLLRDLCRELGVLPHHSIESTYREVVSCLGEIRKIIVIDEAQYLANSFKLAETVKNLNDEVGTGFVFLTEIGGDRLFARFASLFDRMSEIITFKALDGEDIRLIVKEMAEVQIEEDAITVFGELVESRMRPAIVSLNRLERWSRIMKISTITADHIRGMFRAKGGVARPATIIKHAKAVSAA